MIQNKLCFVLSWLFLGLIGLSSLALADDTRVRDLPIPEGATDITYVKRRGDVRFQVTSDFKTTGGFYAKTLAEQQWTKSVKDNVQRNFWVQTFSKDKVSLEVRVDGSDGGSEVRLTPKGMLWDEDDQPTPKDLPLPPDATEIEYDDFFESIEFKSQSDVKSVVEFLSDELEKRKWTKATPEFDLATFVRLKFTQQKSTLDIDVRAEDSGSEISIRTKGMQWDGMKAEIELAEKEAEEVAASTPSKQKTSEMPASIPKRKDKPKQGIEELPKLPSEGTVVMDGTTIKLPHVIAYEVFENDQWSTKVLATQKVIKQETLLARLKMSGTDKDEDESALTFSEPYLLIELDENDRPSRLNLVAAGTPGGSSGNEIDGTALVEAGRARGTVRMKEPDSFFDKVYTAEISFDVPVLTRESTPAKRLSDAPKLANTATLIIGEKKYKLANVVAYEMKRFDELVTTIVFSEKPLNKSNLQAALGKEAADDYFEFIPQVKVIIDTEDNLSSMSIWADNASISGNGGVESDIVIEDGRARGIAKMTEPGEFLDSQYSFEVSFDTDVLRKQASARNRPSNGLVADSYKGLPFPQGHKGMQSEGTQYRTQSGTIVVADLNAVVDFYRGELASGEWGEWKENAADAKVERKVAKLAFSGPTGILIVQLEADGEDVSITLVSRDAQAARTAGLLPAAGKSRLLIGNASEKAAVITINKQEYKIAVGAGAEDPKTGLNWEVVPGNYTVEIQPQGEKVQSEVLRLGADEVWGVIIDPSGGYLALQIY